MSIQEKVNSLLDRMHDSPQYPSQGKVLFVDLAARSTRSAYLDKSVFEHFLGGRGVNMYLLYNWIPRSR